MNSSPVTTHSPKTSEATPLKEALVRLNCGEPVAMPTETVYGLAAKITDERGIDALFRLKERPFFDPLIVHLADVSQIYPCAAPAHPTAAQIQSAAAQGRGVAQVHTVVATFPPLAEKLAAKFWPGPLTLVLPKHPSLNSKITSGLETVGVRVPAHPMARELIAQAGTPLAAPSANKFGRTSPTTAAHVRGEFGDSVFVLDGGACEVGVESTVAGFNDDFTEIRVYRPGAVTEEMLRAFAPTTKMQSPAAPGHLEHHYMPKIPLVILSGEPLLTEELYESLRIQFGGKPPRPSWMQLSEDPRLAARTLYSEMRRAALAPHANCLLLPYDLDKNSTGLFAAITDRLRKAATVCVY